MLLSLLTAVKSSVFFSLSSVGLVSLSFVLLVALAVVVASIVDAAVVSVAGIVAVSLLASVFGVAVSPSLFSMFPFSVDVSVLNSPCPSETLAFSGFTL